MLFVQNCGNALAVPPGAGELYLSPKHPSFLHLDGLDEVEAAGSGVVAVRGQSLFFGLGKDGKIDLSQKQNHFLPRFKLRGHRFGQVPGAQRPRPQLDFNGISRRVALPGLGYPHPKPRMIVHGAARITGLRYHGAMHYDIRILRQQLGSREAHQ